MRRLAPKNFLYVFSVTVLCVCAAFYFSNEFKKPKEKYFDEKAPQNRRIRSVSENEAFPYSTNGTLIFGPLLNTGPRYNLEDYLNSVQYAWTLSPLTSLARSFVASLVSIPLETIIGFVDGSGPAIEIQKIITYELKTIIPAGIGILMAVLVPAIGWLFCCCRCCCGKCGGKMRTVEAEKQKCCPGFTVFVFLILALLFVVAGAGALFQSGTRLLTSPEHIYKTSVFTLDDLKTYMHRSFGEIEQVAVDEFEFVIDTVIQELNDVGDHVSGPFYAESRPLASAVIDTLHTVDTGILSMESSLVSINTTADLLLVEASILTNELATLGANLTAVKSGCVSSCGGMPDGSLVPAIHDFTQIPDISGQLSLVAEAAALNLSSVVDQANSSYLGIPAIISQHSSAVVSAIEGPLQNFSSLGSNQVENIKSSILNNLGMLEKNSTIRTQMKDIIDMVDTYVGYGNYAFMGVACLVLFIALLSVFGILCGVLGFRKEPVERGFMSHTGAHCLMCSTWFSFFFIFYFFLLCAIIFLVGSNLTYFCETLTKPSVFDMILGTPQNGTGDYFLGAMLLNNASIPLTIEGVLQGCQGSGAIYNVLRLNNMIDISTLVDIEENLPDMTGLYNTVNSSMGLISIMDSGVMSNIDALSLNSGLSLNATALTAGLYTGLGSLDLTSLANALYALVGNPGIPDQYEPIYQYWGDQVTALNAIQVARLQSYTDTIHNELTSMEANANTLTSIIPNITTSLTALDDYLQSTAVSTIITSLGDFINRIVSYAEQFMNHVQSRLTNDIGKCTILWHIYEGFTDAACVYFLDSLNGVWMALGMIGFFLIPSIIFSVRLSKYFRIPDDAERIQQYTRRNTMGAVVKELQGVKQRMSNKELW